MRQRILTVSSEMATVRLATLLLVLALLAGCAGTTSGRNSSFAGNGSAPGTSVAVSVTAGQTEAGINITVPPPSASPAPNAQFLGVGGSAAFSSGDVVHRGQTAALVIFGAGLSANMEVSISGPPDIAVSNLQNATANDAARTPGLRFTVVVSPDAALGGRTVMLRNPQGDMTSFSGGLEVVP
jgi:hypothetical protein